MTSGYQAPVDSDGSADALPVSLAESASSYDVDDLNYAIGRPVATGRIRLRPEDFKVDELLGFEPSGEGAHFWVQVEKTSLNTQDVVGLLARATSVAQRDIGISGQKDRNAVTSQWFSLPKGANPDQQMAELLKLCSDNTALALRSRTANSGKLKRGSHRANRFVIVVRDFVGDPREIEERIESIRSRGMPNYFGPQRFGRNVKNLVTAGRLFQNRIRKIDRMARGMALSSARAWIFNQVLSARMGEKGLHGVQIGDALQLDGSNGFFIHDGSDQSVVDRIADHDLHPTGPMWGGGESPVGPAVFEFESAVARQWPVFADGLVRAGLKQQRRALRVIPANLGVEFEPDNVVRLSFELPSGSFATSLLRELVVV